MPQESSGHNRRLKQGVVVATGAGVAILVFLSGRSGSVDPASVGGAQTTTHVRPTDSGLGVTVAPTDAEKPVLVDLAGARAARSSDFRPETPWTLAWSYDCTLLANARPGFVLTVNGTEKTTTAVSRPEPQASGVEHYVERYLEGDVLYLQMTTECPWTVHVVG